MEASRDLKEEEGGGSEGSPECTLVPEVGDLPLDVVSGEGSMDRYQS